MGCPPLCSRTRRDSASRDYSGKQGLGTTAPAATACPAAVVRESTQPSRLPRGTIPPPLPPTGGAADGALDPTSDGRYAQPAPTLTPTAVLATLLPNSFKPERTNATVIPAGVKRKHHPRTC